MEKNLKKEYTYIVYMYVHVYMCVCVCVCVCVKILNKSWFFYRFCYMTEFSSNWGLDSSSTMNLVGIGLQ